MMEIEFKGEHELVWVNVSNSEMISFWATVSETTGRWRTGGKGKAYYTH